MSVCAVNKPLNNVGCGRVNALHAWSNLLVEFQVKDEWSAEGLHQEAALGQMDGLREGWREESKGMGKK